MLDAYRQAVSVVSVTTLRFRTKSFPRNRSHEIVATKSARHTPAPAASLIVWQVGAREHQVFERVRGRALALVREGDADRREQALSSPREPSVLGAAGRGAGRRAPRAPRRAHAGTPALPH